MIYKKRVKFNSLFVLNDLIPQRIFLACHVFIHVFIKLAVDKRMRLTARSVFGSLPIAYCLMPIAYCLLPTSIRRPADNFLNACGVTRAAGAGRENSESTDYTD
jgi:hypothetical protein